jgi:hypothetical protein
MYEVLLQKLDEIRHEYDVKFAKQDKVIGELQRTNENVQKTIAELSTKVARVSYTFFFMTQA